VWPLAKFELKANTKADLINNWLFCSIKRLMQTANPKISFICHQRDRKYPHWKFHCRCCFIFTYTRKLQTFVEAKKVTLFLFSRVSGYTSVCRTDRRTDRRTELPWLIQRSALRCEKGGSRREGKRKKRKRKKGKRKKGKPKWSRKKGKREIGKLACCSL